MAVFELKWYAEAHAILSSTSSKHALPPVYHAAFDFMRHPRFNEIRLTPSKGGFVASAPGGGNSRVHYEGLTKQLDRVFHPTPLNISTGGAKTGGPARGNTVDNELAGVVNHAKLPESGALSRYTLKVLKELRERGLKPFCAQVNVGVASLKLATALDLVCIDLALAAQGGSNLVNVQVKTGFDKNYERGNGILMRSPFAECDALTTMQDCHGNRHKLQLAVEHLLTQLAFGHPLADSILMIISEKTHATIPVTRDAELVSGLYKNLQLRDTMPEMDLEIESIKQKYAVKKIMISRARARAKGKTNIVVMSKQIKVKRE